MAYAANQSIRYMPWNPGFDTYGINSKTHPIPPGSPLADLVCQFYEIQGNPKNPSLLSVIPDGCHDIIFACSPKKMQGFLSVSVDAPRRFQFDNEALLLGIRFLPGADFAPHPENFAAADAPIPLESIFPESAYLAEMLFCAPNFAKRQEILTQFLQKIRPEANRQQHLLHFCTERILRSHGQCTVAQLAQDTGYSVRYIHDLCKKSIGHSPKLFGKMIRMQHAASWITHQPQCSLSDIAAECGYADQSHMYRDFMQLTCHSPSQIREKHTIQLNQNDIKITYFH